MEFEIEWDLLVLFRETSDALLCVCRVGPMSKVHTRKPEVKHGCYDFCYSEYFCKSCRGGMFPGHVRAPQALNLEALWSTDACLTVLLAKVLGQRHQGIKEEEAELLALKDSVREVQADSWRHFVKTGPFQAFPAFRCAVCRGRPPVRATRGWGL